jgi:hypothetical protein
MASRLRVLAAASLLLLVTLPGLCRGGEPARRELSDGCKASGVLRPSKSHSCVDCCKAGKSYPTYRCSPPVVSGSTKVIMTLNDNDFDAGGDGGDPSKCHYKKLFNL